MRVPPLPLKVASRYLFDRDLARSSHRSLSLALLALRDLSKALVHSLEEPVLERITLVLLAEDEALIAVDLETALSEAGFDIRHVASGEEAIDELDRRHSDICGVVTDIRLGDKVDGWAVGRHARELIPGVPIVYMSGDSAREHTIHGVPNSVMLQKPFAVAQLTTALATLINTATPREPPPQIQA